MNAASDLETMEAAVAPDPKSAPVIKQESNTSASTSINEHEHPTEEDLATLRRVSGQIPWTAFAVAFVELCERFSYYGTTAVCGLSFLTI